MATPDRFHGFLAMQSRGLLALPPALRRKYSLDEPGAQVEITEREDGVIELRPQLAVPASQAWFWTEEWQAGEREVDREYAEGNFKTFKSAKEFVAYLESE